MSNIWIPKLKIIEPKRAVIAQSSLQGFFKIEAVRPDGRKRVLADWFPNLITDDGLNVIGTSSSWLGACKVGTGSATPVNGDTALVAQVAGTTTVQASSQAAQGSAPYYGRTTKTFRFALGAAAGNLAEIGIGTLVSGGTLFSRALILDGGGSPTTITVLADEYLDATYEIRIKPPLVDVPDTINISGTDYDIVQRACNVTGTEWVPGGGFIVGSIGGVPNAQVHSGAFAAITAAPGGTGVSPDTNVSAAYSNNSLLREATMTWSLNTANFGGSGILATSWNLASTTGAGGMGCMQASFTPGIPKTSSQVLTLVYRHTWARGTP